MMTRLRSAILPLSLFATALVPLACGSSTPSRPAVCAELEDYTPTTASQLSFATDIYPLFASTTASNGGCSQVGACHGNPPLPINALGTKSLQFLFSPESPAMAKAQLLMASVNASGMQRVSPGSVKNSFLAYKIKSSSKDDGLACISSMCQSGASVGSPPCGDPMPNVGTLSDADRTKILDWIGGGAAD
jgi:hypothetical protein